MEKRCWRSFKIIDYDKKKQGQRTYYILFIENTGGELNRNLKKKGVIQIREKGRVSASKTNTGGQREEGQWPKGDK